MREEKSIIGETHGEYTVLAEAERDRHGRRMFLCRCSCGVEKVVLKQSLLSGNTKSCGHLSREKTADRSRKHGLCESYPRTMKSVRQHFKFIREGYSGYARWELDKRYSDDAEGSAQFVQDLVALYPEECKAYEENKTLVMDKDNSEDAVYRPEIIRFVTNVENLDNRVDTRRLKDETPFVLFCRLVGVPTVGEKSKPTLIYCKYLKYFIRHNGEGHPELIKKATDYIKLLRELKAKLEWLAAIREFKETWKDLLMNLSQKTLHGFTKKQGTLPVRLSSKSELKSSLF